MVNTIDISELGKQIGMEEKSKHYQTVKLLILVMGSERET